MDILEPSQKVSADFAPRLPDAIGAGWYANADDLRWQLALRIAASGSLGRSQLLSDFLLYIVDRSIRGRSDEITEQQIGVIVFGRAEDYNSNDDNIVRSYARKLRKRVDEYFATEGNEEPIRLDIPRGGYAPVFSSNVRTSQERENPAALPEMLDARESKPDGPQTKNSSGSISLDRSKRWSRVAAQLRITPAMLFPLLVGICLGAGSMLLGHIRPIGSQEEAESHILWKQLFSADHDTFIVPSDDGLVIMQRLIDRPVPLAAYVNGTYRTKLKANDQPNADEILKLGGRRYTSVVDLDFAAHLAQLKEVVPERMMIRYARDLRMDDLRSGNAILIGSDEANPWIELFRSQLHYCFRYESDPDKQSGFVNRYPDSGERAVYSTKGQNEQTFGIIAYLPNLSNNGHVLIVAGLNTAGTQAAAAFLLDPSSIGPTLQRARTSNGTLQPFEVLVGAGNVATNASKPGLVLERVGLPKAR